jgi:hypothetical protein
MEKTNISEIKDGDTILCNGEIRPVSKVHISQIRVGDTILCDDGKIRTVCKNNIKRSEFMGITIFGDSHHSGYRLVVRINFDRPL